MPARSKIIQHDLERLVLTARQAGKTRAEVVDACNRDLKRRKINARVSDSAVKRYLHELDAQTTAPAHQAQIVEQHAVLSIDFATQFRDLNAKLVRWAEEADTAIKKVAVPGKGVMDAGPDWDARTKVSREFHRNLGLYADLMERIYNADQVRLLREAVIEAVRDADPETARRVELKLQEKQTIRQAALLGQPTPI